MIYFRPQELRDLGCIAYQSEMKTEIRKHVADLTFPCDDDIHVGRFASMNPQQPVKGQSSTPIQEHTVNAGQERPAVEPDLYDWSFKRNEPQQQSNEVTLNLQQVEAESGDDSVPLQFSAEEHADNSSQSFDHAQSNTISSSTASVKYRRIFVSPKTSDSAPINVLTPQEQKEESLC